MCKKMVVHFIVVFISIFMFGVNAQAGFLDSLVDKAVNKASSVVKGTYIVYQCPPDLNAFDEYKFEDHMKKKYPKYLSSEYREFVNLYRIIGNRVYWSASKFNEKFTIWHKSFTVNYPEYTGTPEMKCIEELVSHYYTTRVANEKKNAEGMEAQRKIDAQNEEAEEAKLEAERRKKVEEEQKAEKELQAKLDTFLPKCDDKIYTMVEYFNFTPDPFGAKGKCIYINALPLQLKSDRAGYFRVRNSMVYIKSNIALKDTDAIFGVAKIKGGYNFTNKYGNTEKIPYFEMLDIFEVVDF